GSLGLAYSWRHSEEEARRLFVRSGDGGRTWSEPVPVIDEPGYLTGAHDRLIVLSTGRLILPCHRLHDGELSTIVARSDDAGMTWQASALITLPVRVAGLQYGLWESSVAERADGSLLLVGRTVMGTIFGSASADGGLTWSGARSLGV